jgi:hypothetical protein
MRVLRAFAIALITGIAAAALVIPVSDYLTQLYHVSNMEGQRGMLIMFGIAPLTTSSLIKRSRNKTHRSGERSMQVVNKMQRSLKRS